MLDRLGTERLTLRALVLDDVHDLVALDSDPAVTRFINGGRPTPRAEMEEIVCASLDHRWVAVERSTGQFVGWFALRPSDEQRRERELGYRLRRGSWGMGVATEGSLAMIAAAFTDLGARRVWAQTMVANTRSRQVMERCGLRHVRTFHLEWPETIEGTELGDVEYEILKRDWDAARAPGADRWH
jgi:RimJ/RimL family protein N-acetyltransferase